MTLTLVFGGTFDPVHTGHTRLARQLLAVFPGSRLCFVPARVPPHRAEPAASSQDRFDMLQIALRDEDGMEADDCELMRDGPSYTVDTLRLFRARLGDNAPVAFVMGMDSWNTLPTWYDWQQYFGLAHLVVMARPGVARKDDPAVVAVAGDGIGRPAVSLAREPAGNVCFVPVTELDVSATRVRQHLRDGDLPHGWLHPGVSELIESRRLYAGTGVTES